MKRNCNANVLKMCYTCMHFVTGSFDGNLPRINPVNTTSLCFSHYAVKKQRCSMNDILPESEEWDLLCS